MPSPSASPSCVPDPPGLLIDPVGRAPEVRPVGRVADWGRVDARGAAPAGAVVDDVGSLGRNTPGSPPSGVPSAPLVPPAVVGGVTWAMSTADVATYSDRFVAGASPDV